MRINNLFEFLMGKYSWWICISVVTIVFSLIPGSLSYSVKCSRGNYFSDGCNHCYCNSTTGVTTCDTSLSLCPQENQQDSTDLYKSEITVSRKCPHGSIFKDRNGNTCKCVEESGAVYCSIHNFKKKSTVQKPEKHSEFSHRHLFSSPVNYPPVIPSETNTRRKLNTNDDRDRDMSEDDYETGNSSGSNSSSGSSSEEAESNNNDKQKISVETAKNLGLIETKDAVEDNSESSKRISMLEYSGRPWGFHPSKLPLSQFRKQIEEVLGTLTYS